MRGKHAAKAARRTLESVSEELDLIRAELVAERELRAVDAKAYRDEIAVLNRDLDKMVEARALEELERVRGVMSAAMSAEREQFASVIAELLPMVRIDRDLSASGWAELRERIVRLSPESADALYADGNRDTRRASRKVRTSSQVEAVVEAKRKGGVR